MKILGQAKIERKTRRIALQILESNSKTKSLYLGGINDNGMRFCKMLIKELSQLTDIEMTSFQIRLNPAKPTSQMVEFDLDVNLLNKKDIIIVDDVANTGRTLFYAFQPLFQIVPKRISCAVLVDRKHKAFPIYVQYVGLSLATTIKDNIVVQLTDKKNMSVELV